MEFYLREVLGALSGCRNRTCRHVPRSTPALTNHLLQPLVDDAGAAHVGEAGRAPVTVSVPRLAPAIFTKWIISDKMHGNVLRTSCAPPSL